MKINPQVEQSYIRHWQTDRDAVQPREKSKLDTLDSRTNKQPGVQTRWDIQESRSVLSPNELATLNAFFGTDTNADREFYGNRPIQPIYKGQLLDMKG